MPKTSVVLRMRHSSKYYNLRCLHFINKTTNSEYSENDFLLKILIKRQLYLEKNKSL